MKNQKFLFMIILVFSIIITNNTLFTLKTDAQEALILSHTSVSLEHGQSIRLQIQNDVSNIRYTTDRPDIVSLSRSGFLVAKKPGKAFVTVTADGLHAKCQIRVIRPTITLSRKKLTIKAGKNKLLKTFVSSGYHPVFRSNNKRVATVNDLGRIYAKKKGTAKISVSFDGVKKICNVTVK